MDFQYYYDIDGVFVWRRILNRKNDSINRDLSDSNIIINYSSSPNWENVKNDIMIKGKLLDNGIQIMYNYKNNELNNPFRISEIGNRKFTVSDEKILTQEQAERRGKYEGFLHGDLNEEVSFSCVPILNMEGNWIIRLKNKSAGIDGKYRVKSFNIPFDTGLSSVSCSKLYYDKV
jgi:hypothetical protein